MRDIADAVSVTRTVLPGLARDRIAAVVVTHNRLDQLQATVMRLLDEGVDHLLVYDNASTDDTPDWLGALTDRRLTVLLSETNDGGAAGFARAMEAARDRFDPDWFVLMDDDARPEPGAIAAFRALDRSQWDALAAAVYYPDGAVCRMNRPIVNRLKKQQGRRARRGFVPHHLKIRDYENGPVRQVAASSFVGFFVRREAVARIGLPDESLFLYGEDGLYTLSITRAGMRLGFAPQIRFEHDCQSLGTRRAGFKPVWKAYYYHRNLLIFYRTSMGGLFWPVLAFYLLPRWAWKARHQPGESRAYLKHLRRAVRDGIADHRGHTDRQI